MPIRKILLASLLTALYGCQPETPVQQETVMQPASAPVHAAVVQEASIADSAPAVDAPVAPPVKAEPAAKKALAAAPAADKAVSPPATQAAVAAPVVAAPVVAAPVVAAPVVAAATAPVAKPAVVVSEADALALAKKNNCLACHAIDKKMVGPAWKAVAVKYRGDAGAEAHLVNKIAKGGSGVWGSMAMPGNSKISEADRTTLARFVLNLQ